MKSTPRIACKLLSLLLDYPDRELWDRLCEVDAMVGRLPSDSIKTQLHAALAGMRQSTLAALQQNYTALFDMNPGTTLNMTYHLYGDSEKRAAALVRLRQIYHHAGYDGKTAELPDYLPLMLEFLAECPHEEHKAAVWESMGDVSRLSMRLMDDAPVYARLLKALGEVQSAVSQD